MTNLEELLDAAMLCDVDGGPWETALAEALDAVLAVVEPLLSTQETREATDILEEYRAAQARMAEDGLTGSRERG